MARSYATLTLTGISSALAYSQPLNSILVLNVSLTKETRIKPSCQFSQLFFPKFELAVFDIDVDGLAFADFAFENIDAERVENFSLDGAPQRAGAVDRVVAFARQQFFSGIGRLER